MTIFVIDDVTSRLKANGHPIDSVRRKQEIVRFYFEELQARVGVKYNFIIQSALDIRHLIDRFDVEGECISLERTLFRCGARVVGDTFTVDEYGARAIICKPGYESAASLGIRLQANLITIEDLCAVSGNTALWVAEKMAAYGKVTAQINVGVMSRRAANAFDKAKIPANSAWIFERLKCLEARDLLFEQAEYSSVRGMATMSNSVRAEDIIGGLPLSRVDHQYLVDLTSFSRLALSTAV